MPLFITYASYTQFGTVAMEPMLRSPILVEVNKPGNDYIPIVKPEEQNGSRLLFNARRCLARNDRPDPVVAVEGATNQD